MDRKTFLIKGPLLLARAFLQGAEEEREDVLSSPQSPDRPAAGSEVRTGRARISLARCLAWQGIDLGCDYCVSRCPVGPAAILISRRGGRREPRVLEGCTGCGECEFFCPTTPKAIRVNPL